MNEFERELRRELQRVPAPDSLADRVMEHVARKRRARKTRAWLGSMMLLAILSAAGVVERQHYERRQAEIARQQLDLAVRVTDRALSQVEQRINWIGVKSSEVEQ